MSACYQSKTDEDTFSGDPYPFIEMKDLFPGFRIMYESRILVMSLGCFGFSKVTYQKETINRSQVRTPMFPDKMQ
jgi:hypothetical protein